MRSVVLGSLRVGAVAALAVLFAASPALAQKSLVSTKTDQAPTIDGAGEAVWDRAPAYKVTANKTVYKPAGYKGLTKTTVTLKSLYDQDYVYFLVQYDDPTQSLERQPWVKQADGTWKQRQDKDNTGHDNTYYEDKFSVLWNINAANFEKRGCEVGCHRARGGKVAGIPDKSPGRMYANKAGETIDMWHWKGVRSNPVGQVDDQYIDANKDPKKSADWGRHGDAKTGGGYANNVNAAKTGPAFMNKPGGDAPRYWVLAESKTEFVDTFKPGDVVPGIVVEPFSGSRGDIEAKGAWKDGRWTIEMKRRLVTTGDKVREQDVQFDDLGKTYHFGVAVFDNSQINHVYHEGAHALTFQK